jgi:hypothetical protein
VHQTVTNPLRSTWHLLFCSLATHTYPCHHLLSLLCVDVSSAVSLVCTLMPFTVICTGLVASSYTLYVHLGICVHHSIYPEKITSEMYENDQATIKMRYCGHLYSPLLKKWTHLDQKDQVFYCMGRGLILETIGSLSCGLLVCTGVGPHPLWSEWRCFNGHTRGFKRVPDV